MGIRLWRLKWVNGCQALFVWCVVYSNCHYYLPHGVRSGIWLSPPLNITLQHCLIGTIAYGHLFREWWQEACGCWQGWGSHKARKIKWTWLGEDFISKANKSTFILLTVECHLRFLSQRMTWNTTRAEFKYLPSSQAARLSLPYSSEWYVTGCALQLVVSWSKEGFSNHWDFHFCPRRRTAEPNWIPNVHSDNCQQLILLLIRVILFFS